MIRLATLGILGSLVLILCSPVAAKPDKAEIRIPKGYKAPIITASDRLATVAAEAVKLTVAERKNVNEEQLAVTLIDLRNADSWQVGSFRGDQRTYPASVVKLFYLAAVERQLEDGQVKDSPEIERAIRNMIVDSSNDATQFLVDVITGTSSGPDLAPKLFEDWQFKRNRVNRWLAALGYSGINVDQKTVCEDAYGVEQQSRKLNGGNLNSLTTNAVARMLAEIVTRRMNTPERTAQMMSLLSRDWTKTSTDLDNQAAAFTGRMLRERKLDGVRLWSKAGWTSTTRHDAVYLETPDGQKLVVVVFTVGHAAEHDIIPALTGHIFDEIRGR
ncbi:MAG TPA: serine hydrolase [Pyrinomonadaceae bacterium]|nr:serine hydrolase [Pyrinomonadaceae bacterium]